MKKSLAALCVLSACMTSAYAQTNVTVYGIADLGVAYTPTAAVSGTRNTAGLAQVWSGMMQQSRLGFKGTEDLGNGLKALFVLESGFAMDTGASGNSQPGSTTGTLFGRASYVGLSSANFGTVQIGRRKDFTDSIATWYSSVEDFGSFINGPHVANLDRVGGNRANNQIRYDTPNFGGFVANATYAMGENAASNANGQSYGFGVNYNNGPFGIGAAYWQAKTSTVANTNSDQSLSALCTSAAPTFGAAGTTCLKVIDIGSSYRTGPFRFYGMFSRTMQPNAVAAPTAAPNFAAAFTSASLTGVYSAGGTNNNSTSTVDVGIDYHITSALKLTVAYLQSRNSFIGANATGSIKQLNFAADYNLSKRTDVYAFLGNMRASDMYSPGIVGAPGVDNSQWALFTGMRHTF